MELSSINGVESAVLLMREKLLLKSSMFCTGGVVGRGTKLSALPTTRKYQKTFFILNLSRCSMQAVAIYRGTSKLSVFPWMITHMKAK